MPVNGGVFHGHGRTERRVGPWPKWMLWVAVLWSSQVLSQDGEPVLILNEVDPQGDREWIELYNPSGRDEALDGYVLVAAAAGGVAAVNVESVPGSGCRSGIIPKAFSLPSGTVVPPRDFYVVCFDVSESNPCPADYCEACLPLNLDRDGGEIALFWGPGCQPPSVRADAVIYPPLPAGTTYGRRGPAGDWCVLSEATPATPNWECPVAPRFPCNPTAPGFPCLANRTRVRINEVSSAACFDVGCPDLVEFQLIGDGEEDLAGYQLINNSRVFEVPKDMPSITTLTPDSPRAVLYASSDPAVLFEPQEEPRVLGTARFGIKGSGDNLVLLSPDRRSWDRVWVPPLATDEYYARIPDGGDFTYTTEFTPGAPNRVRAGGLAPCVEIIDRFPLRVLPHEPGAPVGLNNFTEDSTVRVYAKVSDRDDDVDRVDLLFRRADHVDVAPDIVPMVDGKRVICDRVLERGIFVAEFAAPAEPTELVFWVRARDRGVGERPANESVSDEFTVVVQDPAWQDPSGDMTHVLRINEVAARAAEDSIELFNPLAFPVFIDGLELTDNVLRPGGTFPANTLVPPRNPDGTGGFLLVVCDGLTEKSTPSSPHMPFRLSACRDEGVLIHRTERVVIDAVHFTEEKAEATLGRVPDGGEVLALIRPTPGESNAGGVRSCFESSTLDFDTDVVINELCTDNKVTLADAGREYGDWLELFNRGDEDAALDGWSLVDAAILRDTDDRTPWFFPPGVCIPAKGHLLIWCDNDEDCENVRQGPGCPGLVDGELHTSFQLNRLADSVQLVNPDGVVVQCIAAWFQARDVSVGRFPDGSGELGFLAPTPGAANDKPLESLAALGFTSCDAVELDPEFELVIPLARGGCAVFLRGDANSDCRVDLSDAVSTLNHLFRGAKASSCADAADADDNGRIEITDAIQTLNALFLGAEPLPPPGMEVPGVDPTGDRLRPPCEEAPCHGRR